MPWAFTVTALPELENRMELVTGKLKKERAMKEKIVELVPIRNRALQKRIERLCNWLTEKQVDDSDGKRLVFKVGTT